MIQPTEGEHVRRCTPEMRGWYDLLRSEVLHFGTDVHLHTTKSYIVFQRKGRNFAYFNIRPTLNQIVIDIAHPHRYGQEVPFAPDLLSEHPGQRKGRALRIRVDSADDAERARPLLEQSYHFGR